jgi:GAF domain
LTDRVETSAVLEWADQAAAYGGFIRALAWLDAVRVFDGELPAAYARKRSAWAQASRARGQFAGTLSTLHARRVDIRQMVVLSQELEAPGEMTALLDRALEGALALLRAGLGNIQIRDPGEQALTIACSSGFGSEFLEYFAVVDDASSACGRAVREHSQTVIADVADDPAFAPHREIAAASGFRAVQSTPLVGPAGRLAGVISTHTRDPYRWSPGQLQLIALYGERVAASIARCEQLTAGELMSLRPIELDHVLSVLLDFDRFGGGSAELVAWELGTSEELISRLWPRLVHDELIEPAESDDIAGEGMWQLTDLGRGSVLAAG